MRRLPPGGRKDGWATEVLKNYLLTPRPWVSLMVVLVTFAVWLLVKKGFHHFRNNDHYIDNSNGALMLFVMLHKEQHGKHHIIHNFIFF